MQNPEKEIRFLRDSRKRQVGLKKRSSSKHTGEDSDSNSATQLLDD